MAKKTVSHNGHLIEVPGTSLTGKEEVRYDGRVVSSKHSVTGATHVFSVEEDGERVQYEVEIGTRWHGMSAWSTVRCEGKVIFSDR